MTSTDKFKPAPAAKYVDLSPSTLAKLRCKGGGPRYMKVGKLIFYAKADLDDWLASCRHRSTSEYKATRPTAADAHPLRA